MNKTKSSNGRARSSACRAGLPVVLLLVGLALSAVPGHLRAGVIRRVDGTLTTGANDGTTWPTAYTSLVYALANTVDTDELWVKQGTHAPGTAATDYFDISAKNLYGGFVGDEVSRGARDWSNNVTTLSGDLGGAVYARNIVKKTAAGTAILDGFTVRDADSNVNAIYGGGLYCSDGEVEILNCTFSSNVVKERAGAVYLDSAAATHTISNTLFIANGCRAGSGGGIYLNSGDMDVYNSRFVTNAAPAGGATYAGLGAYIEAGLSPTFSGCHFSNNIANYYGGAIRLVGPMGS
ncbi:MAG: hypothetical protein HQ559_17900, partial [Lentisphaerae bacterium]|nr:hypothetical protein [Lentisphaerota bacterium]